MRVTLKIFRLCLEILHLFYLVQIIIEDNRIHYFLMLTHKRNVM